MLEQIPSLNITENKWIINESKPWNILLYHILYLSYSWYGKFIIKQALH